MNGYQISFFTQQDKRHGHTPLAEWLMLAARDMGIRGATIIAGSEGYGHHRRIHSANFFELADQPQEVIMTLTEDETNMFFAFLKEEGVHCFYVKSVVEFGVLGEPDQ